MLTNRYCPLILTLLVLLSVCPAQAKEHHDDGHHDDHHDAGTEESLQAHAHGTAELFIVLAGQKLEIELHSPAINLIGFEHKPKNDEQKAKVEELEVKLTSASELFQISSAECQLNTQELDLGNLALEDSEHEEEHHDEDKEHHDGDHDDEETHSDIEAQYSFSCQQPSSLRSLVTTIPNEFPSVESLEVQWIVNGRQGATVLEHNQTEIVFK